MYQKIGFFRFFEGGTEACHQVMGQMADESHGIGYDRLLSVAQFQRAGSGIKGCKEFVLHQHPGVGQSVEKC